MHAVCGCVCHFPAQNVNAIDTLAVHEACVNCKAFHLRSVDGARLCVRCEHEKWKHTEHDGCAGTYLERCMCPTFISTTVVQ